MHCQWRWLFVAAGLVIAAVLWGTAHAEVNPDCTLRGTALHGKVQVVPRFATFKVQVVSSFPDLKVERVARFSDRCGQWQFVDSFPDFTIQYVKSFPDLTIQFVPRFPGAP